MPNVLKSLTPPEINQEISDRRAVSVWGGFYPSRVGFVRVVANGDYLSPFKSKYRLMGFELLLSERRDPLDDPILKSAIYDIQSGNVEIAIAQNDFAQSLPGANLGLLLVPKDADISSANTTRQAQSLGAKRIWFGAAQGGVPVHR
jgi:hypothetical protein